MPKKPAAKKPAADAGLPIHRFKDAAAYDAWLAKHHATSTGIRIELARAGSGIASITAKEAVDVSITWGWIDGQSRSIDASWWHQRFAPRGPKSLWSKVNREKVEVFTKAGRMHPAGLAAVDAAKADGRWAAAYDPPSKATIPDDLAAALDADPEAKAFFATLNTMNRYAFLHRLHTAKKPETRARRLSQFMALLHEGKTLH